MLRRISSWSGLVFTSTFLLGCTSLGGDARTASGGRSGLPDRDPALARKLVREDGALLLDVRSVSEFESGHVEGAVLIPHTEIEARLEEIIEALGGDKTKPIVVYCRSGRRSGFAKQTLVEHGFTQVSNLGGYSSWCEDCVSVR